MMPFRIYDREKKEMWIVLNFHPSTTAGSAGSYLVTREDDDVEKDGQMQILPAEELARHRMVDFLDDGEPEFDD